MEVVNFSVGIAIRHAMTFEREMKAPDAVHAWWELITMRMSLNCQGIIDECRARLGDATLSRHLHGAERKGDACANLNLSVVRNSLIAFTRCSAAAGKKLISNRQISRGMEKHEKSFNLSSREFLWWVIMQIIIATHNSMHALSLYRWHITEHCS